MRLLNTALVNGFTMITYQRPLAASDDFDQAIDPDREQSVIWAVGKINSGGTVAYHNALRNRGMSAQLKNSCILMLKSTFCRSYGNPIWPTTAMELSGARRPACKSGRPATRPGSGRPATRPGSAGSGFRRGALVHSANSLLRARRRGLLRAHGTHWREGWLRSHHRFVCILSCNSIVFRREGRLGNCVVCERPVDPGSDVGTREDVYFRGGGRGRSH